MKNIILRRTTHVFSVGLCCLCMSSCAAYSTSNSESNSDTEITAHFWETPPAGGKYPELAEDSVKKRASFGVAFRGGGNRAAPATLGQIRALHDLGWIDSVRYLSAISGGSWTAIPYTYLKNTCSVESSIHCDEERFLGASVSPAEVARRLPVIANERLPKEFTEGSMLGAISNGAISGKVVKAWLKGRFDESLSDALGAIYLQPFGLGRRSATDSDSIFTWRSTDEKKIRQDNPRFLNTQVHYVERERPYLIVGGTVLTRRTFIKPKNKLRLEMTPLYTGIPRRAEFESKALSPLKLGGGFIESFGYDYVTDHVDETKIPTTLTLRDPIYGNRTDSSRLNFSLANMAGISGAAPVETAVSIRILRLVASNFGFPEHYVPVNQRSERHRKTNKGETYEKEWAHGDGGHEDNLGLLPLLTRSVDNIIVFANSVVPLDKSKIIACGKLLESNPPLEQDPKKLDKQMSSCIKMIDDDIPSFFVKTKRQIHNTGLKLANNTTPKGQEHLSGYYDILTIARELRDNRGLSCNKFHYTYQQSEIATGSQNNAYSPNICILFLGLDKEWISGIKDAAIKEGLTKKETRTIQKTLNLDTNWTSASMREEKPGRKDFPHIATFGDMPGFLIKTSKTRLYALDQFASWKMAEHSEDISKFFLAKGQLSLD